MYIALRLLRDGAHTTITTRFPRDAARRFTAMADSARVAAPAAHRRHRPARPGAGRRARGLGRRAGPLDILINNAAQTVRRSPAGYALLAEAEAAPLPAGPLPEIRRSAARSDAQAGVELARRRRGGRPPLDADARRARRARADRGLGLARADRAEPAIDAGGLVPDLHPVNSWSQRVDEVDPVELLEVQLCNVTAPFILVSRLRPALAASTARRKYVVNVSAMEGQFSRGYKGPGHPHTNMAKAALNMLTRTSAQEMLETDGILMTSVDTGWITDERPHPTKMRLADEGFHAPLDLVDGAARVYDPIVRGEAGEDLYGCFLKDYEPAPW